MNGWTHIEDDVPNEGEKVLTAYYYERYDSWYYDILKWKKGNWMGDENWLDGTRYWDVMRMDILWWHRLSPPDLERA